MNSVETIDTQIVDITRTVFESMLGWNITDSEAAGEADGTEPHMTGLVTVTGNWEGAVSLVVSRKLAVQIAAAMFGSDPTCEVEEEICDALGEMANMIGGNFKSTLEPPVQLSLPSVTKGVGYETFIPGSTKIISVHFEHEGEAIVVTIVSRGSSD